MRGRQACAELAVEACAPIKSQESCRARSRSRCQELFGLTEASRPPALEVYFIHARLELLDDVETRAELLSLPTSLQLPEDTVRLLIDAAGPILEASPDYRRLLQDLGVAADE